MIVKIRDGDGNDDGDHTQPVTRLLCLSLRGVAPLQPPPNIVNPKSRVTSGVRIPAPASPSPQPGTPT